MSDDETVAFKSYLLSLGIDDPVTRETHGSGQQYYRELAREVCRVLDAPVKVRSCTFVRFVRGDVIKIQGKCTG